MLQIPAWWRVFILVMLALGLVVAIPNGLPQNLRDRLPSWLPKEAVNLGLDLQGGSYLLLEVDLPVVQRDRAEALMGDVGAALRRANIAMTGLTFDGNSVGVTVTDMGRYDEAKRLLTELNPQMTSSLVPGARQYQMSEPGNGRIILRQTEAFAEMTRQQILQMVRQVSPVLQEFLDSRAILGPSLRALVGASAVLNDVVPGDYANLKLAIDFGGLNPPDLLGPGGGGSTGTNGDGTGGLLGGHTGSTSGGGSGLTDALGDLLGLGALLGGGR